MILAIVFATFALFAALGALWFTAEAMKRLEGRGEGMVKPYLGELRRDTHAALKGVRELSARMERVENDIAWLKRQGVDTVPQDDAMAGARDALARLERMQPSVSLNG